MKKLIIILLVAISISAKAQQYEKAMGSNIAKLYTLTTSTELQDLGNTFERIANAESDKWLPAYYAAYCHVRSTFFEQSDNDAKQQQLDKAQGILDNLLEKYNNESELYCLQALAYQLRITDMNTGAEYSPKASKAIAIAQKINPNNPRAWYLQGSNLYHTPESFGGGADKAKPLIEKAAALFEEESTQSTLMPTWGAIHNKKLLEQCNKK